MSEQSPSPASPRSDGGGVDQVVSDLLAPVIETTGVELIDVEWSGGTLRVVVDEVASDGGGVTADRLAEVNRLISPVLDQHDPVPGKYLLEVSSPGVERPLRRDDHYNRAVGEDVIVKLVPGADPRRVKGRLVSFENDTLQIDVVEVDGVDLAEPERHEITLDDVAKARTHFDWGPAPKAGGNKNKNKKKQQQQRKKKSPNAGKNKKSSGKKPKQSTGDRSKSGKRGNQ